MVVVIGGVVVERGFWVVVWLVCLCARGWDYTDGCTQVRVMVGRRSPMYVPVMAASSRRISPLPLPTAMPITLHKCVGCLC